MNLVPLKDALARRPVTWLVALTAALLVGVVGIHWQLSAQELRTVVQQSTEEANKTLTRIFVNESWERVRPLLPRPGAGAEAARTNPRVADIDEIVRRFSRTTDVLKVKIYDLDGTTVYSSDAAQIGENKARNPGFMASARGQVASELTHRGSFGAFDGELYQRDLVSTYVPVRVDERIEAVLEIYADRTASIAFLRRVSGELAWDLMVPLTIALLVMVVAAALLQGLQTRRATAIGQPGATGAAPGHAAAALSPMWLPGADDPIARALEELSWEIAALKSTSEQREPSRRDDSTLQRLQVLTEDIQAWLRTASDLALLRTGGQVGGHGVFSVDELLDALVALPARHAAARGVQFSLYKHPSTLGPAEGDSARIASLLGHMLGLAVAATRRGRIELKVLRTAGGMRVDLIDSSPGWPQERLDLLTKAWDTGILPSPAEVGLDGLRLVLCRGLAHALGGHADFRSTPDHGSRLSVELPLEAPRH